MSHKETETSNAFILQVTEKCGNVRVYYGYNYTDGLVVFQQTVASEPDCHIKLFGPEGEVDKWPKEKVVDNSRFPQPIRSASFT